MTENVKVLLNQLKDKSYKKYRVHFEQTPILYDNDFFGFHFGANKACDPGRGNVTPNYKRVLEKGFDSVRKEIEDNISATLDEKKKAYGAELLHAIDNCFSVCDSFQETVKKSGNMRLYNALLKVPHQKAETFFEACVFLKICIYFLRVSNVSHLGLGRFDQYMYPYYKADREKGVTDEELFETLEAFFVSLNFDADLYSGVQQGDNGQSMVLGGFDKEGNSVYNELSEMCMKASLELNLIDPKINLRVGKNTPDELFILGTQLTKKGLGFPQYCNDDVVVPGLVKLGYNIDDAIDYVVAACWEFIVPNCGADIPNRATMNFPLVVNNVIHSKLYQCDRFDELMNYVGESISAECDQIVADHSTKTTTTQPLLSIFTDGCIETLTDMWRGGTKYLNFGCHGAGIANATDALVAVKTCVFDNKSITASELLAALNDNFEGHDHIRSLLRACPKMGNNDSAADEIALQLMSHFSKNLNNRKNDGDGIWRAGTGSAQEYIWSAKKCPATADGRLAFEPYSSSFSPSLDVKTNGLLSIIQSFTKYDLTEIINGGPLTLEIHDSVLRNDMGVEKTAQLVKAYIHLGGHQLQLNSINRETLLDAQKHPEKYPNLIVRVWGWSGYFNELDLEYQNHIIRRCEYTS